MNQKQRERKGVDRQQFRRRTNRRFRPPRKYQRKVEKQSRCQKPRNNLRPINSPVKRVQLSAVMKRPKNEGYQTKNVKMYSAWRIPAPDENEQADEEIEESNDSEVVLGRQRLLGRRRQKARFEFFSAAGEFVVYLGP